MSGHQNPTARPAGVTATIRLGRGALEYRWIDGTDPARAPLVFLHEGLGCAAMWLRFPEQLARATGRSALVYSRHGYGASAPLTAPRDAGYLHEEADRVLPELLDRLGVERPLLVGHSDGASIALLYAGAQTAAGVVAMAPHVIVEPETLAGVAAAEVEFAAGGLADRLAWYHDDPETVFRSWAGVWRSPEFAGWNALDRLPGIRCPVLLVQGDRDRYGTMRQLDAVQRRVSGPVRRLELPGCGHAPHLERAEEVRAAVADHARELP